MAWTEIDYQVLAAPASSVTFSTGLSTYKFFRLTGYVLNDANAKGVLFSINSDTTNANYARQMIEASSTTITGLRNTGSSATARALHRTDLAANQAASLTIILAKPSASVKGQLLNQFGNNASPVLVLNGYEWNNTADGVTALSIIAETNNFAAGTSFLLEGLAF